MGVVVVLLLSLLWSVVYCQTFPYISVDGEPAIDNNSYVENSPTFMPSSADRTGGGYLDYKTIRCQTNLRTCCGHDYSHHGDWYLPNGTVIKSDYGDAHSYQGEQAVYLRQDYSYDYYYDYDSSPPSGIYCCRIPTEDIHNDRDVSVRDTVCVGLYDTGKCSLLDAGWQSMCRLDTRTEVLRGLDAEWEVHLPRPTTRQLYLVVLSEVLNRLRYGTRIVERLVASRFGPLES